MLELIVSGGQTGADRAGLDAALLCGMPHGGWCPQGRRAEDGRLPERYLLRETEGFSYLARTERNVKESDGTVIFTLAQMTDGSWRTSDFANRHGRPWLHVRVGGMTDGAAVARVMAFVREHGIRRLNVAGSSGSRAPGLYDRVLAVMVRVLAECRVEGPCGRLSENGPQAEEGKSDRIDRILQN